MDCKKVAVVGSGLIGRSFAMLFASADYDVTIYDLESHQAESALADIKNQLRQLSEQGLLRGKLSEEEQFSKITKTENLEECVKGAFFIQECVPEMLEIKRSVWEHVDQLVGDNVIMSTSVSTLLPSVIAEGLKHKNRFIVSHPTNPPYYVPAIEVVPTKWTDTEVTNRTIALLKEVGQVPVLLEKEVDGFVLNRLQYAVMGEAYNLIQEGVVSPEGCELLVSQGLGLRYAFMGPWETSYLNADGIYSFENRYGDMMLEIQKSFRVPEITSRETLKQIHESMEIVAGPVETLRNRRDWRDRRLVALTKLKIDMDKEDSSKN